MQIFYSDGGTPWVVEPVHCAYAEEEDDRTVEDEKQDDNSDHAHQGDSREVALAVRDRAKGRCTRVVEDAMIHLSLDKETLNLNT